MQTQKKIRLLDRVKGRLCWATRHSRLKLFWTIAVVGLLLPWLPSCDTAVRSHCTVNSIYDGDTMRLTCDAQRIKVRLYCIDAPETSQRPWGREARNHLREITPAQVVLIARTKDRYGRTVGEVLTADKGGDNLNLAMVRSGNAAVYPQYCDDRQYFQAEREARQAGRGIWNTPGAHQTPWDTRH